MLMKTPLHFITVILIFIFTAAKPVNSQSSVNDIPASQLPSDVKAVFDQYIKILNSEDLNKCGAEFSKIAGGSLVNPSGTALRSSVKPYSLKKDFDNIHLYHQPVKITRVNKSFSNGKGYGESAIKGDVFKIWIAKKEGQAGMPAPVSIMVPQGHASIKSPKVVTIGSY